MPGAVMAVQARRGLMLVGCVRPLAEGLRAHHWRSARGTHRMER